MPKLGENEQEYSIRTNNGASRFESVQSPEKVVTMYIDGLYPTIRTIGQRYRENHRKAIYLELVQHSKYESQAVRARGVQPVAGDSRPASVVKPARCNTNLLQSSLESVMTAATEEEHVEEALRYTGECPKEK